MPDDVELFLKGYSPEVRSPALQLRTCSPALKALVRQAARMGKP